MATLLEFWEQLAKNAPSQTATYRLQLAAARQSLRAYAAISDPDQMHCMLIEMPASLRPKDLAKVSTRAFEARFAELTGLPPGHCAIVLRLQEPGFLDLFGIFGEEILRAIDTAPTEKDACKAVVSCIDRWRRFVERGRRLLTEEEGRGLFGELIVLARCIALLGSDTAVACWRGPENALRDFELPDVSVEVKTYQSDSGASIRINDPQQLDVVSSRPVFLAVIRLARSDSGGLNLADLIHRIRALAVNSSTAHDRLEDLLSAAGYMDAQSAQYVERYIAGPLTLYAVTDAFPRILNSHIPAGVVDVHFSLLLAALGTHQVDPVPLLGPSLPGFEVN